MYCIFNTFFVYKQIFIFTDDCSSADVVCDYSFSLPLEKLSPLTSPKCNQPSIATNSITCSINEQKAKVLNSPDKKSVNAVPKAVMNGVPYTHFPAYPLSHPPVYHGYPYASPYQSRAYIPPQHPYSNPHYTHSYGVMPQYMMPPFQFPFIHSSATPQHAYYNYMKGTVPYAIPPYAYPPTSAAHPPLVQTSAPNRMSVPMMKNFLPRMMKPQNNPFVENEFLHSSYPGSSSSDFVISSPDKISLNSVGNSDNVKNFGKGASSTETAKEHFDADSICDEVKNEVKVPLHFEDDEFVRSNEDEVSSEVDVQLKDDDFIHHPDSDLEDECVSSCDPSQPRKGHEEISNCNHNINSGSTVDSHFHTSPDCISFTVDESKLEENIEYISSSRSPKLLGSDDRSAPSENAAEDQDEQLRHLTLEIIENLPSSSRKNYSPSFISDSPEVILENENDQLCDSNIAENIPQYFGQNHHSLTFMSDASESISEEEQDGQLHNLTSDIIGNLLQNSEENLHSLSFISESSEVVLRGQDELLHNFTSKISPSQPNSPSSRIVPEATERILKEQDQQLRNLTEEIRQMQLALLSNQSASASSSDRGQLSPIVGIETIHLPHKVNKSQSLLPKSEFNSCSNINEFHSTNICELSSGRTSHSSSGFSIACDGTNRSSDSAFLTPQLSHTSPDLVLPKMERQHELRSKLDSGPSLSFPGHNSLKPRLNLDKKKSPVRLTDSCTDLLLEDVMSRQISFGQFELFPSDDQDKNVRSWLSNVTKKSETTKDTISESPSDLTVHPSKPNTKVHSADNYPSEADASKSTGDVMNVLHDENTISQSCNKGSLPQLATSQCKISDMDTFPDSEMQKSTSFKNLVQLPSLETKEVSSHDSIPASIPLPVSSTSSKKKNKKKKKR